MYISNLHFEWAESEVVVYSMYLFSYVKLFVQSSIIARLTARMNEFLHITISLFVVEILLDMIYDGLTSV